MDFLDMFHNLSREHLSVYMVLEVDDGTDDD